MSKHPLIVGLAVLVLLVATLLPEPVRADAELPEAARLAAGSIPAAVQAQAHHLCIQSSIDPARWTWYSLPLDARWKAVLVGCVFAASNDIYMVMIERPEGNVEPARLGRAGARVANPRWDQKNGILIDINGSGAGCSVEQRWRWAQNRFVLARKITRGCRR